MVFCYGSLNWLRHWPCGVILSDAVSRVGLVRVRPCESQACGVDSVCSSSLVLQLCIHMCACVFGSHFSQRWWSNPLQWWYPKLVCRPLRYPKASQNTVLRLSLVLLAPIRLETKWLRVLSTFTGNAGNFRWRVCAGADAHASGMAGILHLWRKRGLTDAGHSVWLCP